VRIRGHGTVARTTRMNAAAAFDAGAYPQRRGRTARKPASVAGLPSAGRCAFEVTPRFGPRGNSSIATPPPHEGERTGRCNDPQLAGRRGLRSLPGSWRRRLTISDRGRCHRGRIARLTTSWSTVSSSRDGRLVAVMTACTSPARPPAAGAARELRQRGVRRGGSALVSSVHRQRWTRLAHLRGIALLSNQERRTGGSYVAGYPWRAPGMRAGRDCQSLGLRTRRR
jgi:hypothetical protein